MTFDYATPGSRPARRDHFSYDRFEHAYDQELGRIAARTDAESRVAEPTSQLAALATYHETGKLTDERQHKRTANA
jgi:hypothetical protein